MTDRRLQYVVATARYGSFTAAGKKVGISQSAITKSVADLEHELGYSLFNRTARGVLLTEEGRTFVVRAERLLEETHDLLHGTFAGSDPYAGMLRIGVCPASLEWLLVEPLGVLISRHPSIRLDVVGGSFDKVVQQLRAGAVDVALGHEAAFEQQPDFRCHPTPPLRTRYFVRLGHPILERDPVTANDIARYDLISPSNSSPYEAYFRRLYEDAGVDPGQHMHFVDYFPITEKLVRNTDAISLVSVHYTHSARFKGRFACLPFLDDAAPAPLCCATRLRWTPRPAVRAFIKACRDRFPDVAVAA